jgi:diguanylate cyclase (GGDEF)-like protein
MKQKPIDFRELLERLLPLDELPAVDRLRVQRALRTGITSQLEQAALMALAQLEQRGTVTRLPATRNGEADLLRYQPRDAIDVITVQLPAPRERDGILICPRLAGSAQAHAGLDQVRRLLHLDDPVFVTDPRRASSGLALAEQLSQAGQEILGASEFRYVPVATSGESDRLSIDADLANEARSNLQITLYCPDTARSQKLADLARGGIHSVALTGVASKDGKALGHVEVTSSHTTAFRPEDLAMIALLADYCALALARSMQIEKLVFVDALTSAYNRSYFDLQVQNEMARAQRDHSSLALLIVDIDDFKSFNTRYGYEAGNEVLIQVARALKRGVRPFDTVSRWGGEEFAVLLTAPVGSEDVVTISERLRTLVERQLVRIESLDRTTHRVGVTVSIGVALYPDHEDNAADLWRAANQALLNAKRPPKNRVVFHQPQSQSRDPRWLSSSSPE